MERLKLKSEKISQSIVNMHTSRSLGYYFYAEFLHFVNFYEDSRMSTAGVNVKNSKLNFYYNPEFVDKLSQEEVNFLVLHELFHLLHKHFQRTLINEHDFKLANIAQDMIINKLIITHTPATFAKFIEGGVILLKEYEKFGKPEIYEFVYEWLKQEKQKYDENKKSGGDGTKNSENGTGTSQDLKEIFDRMEAGESCTTDEHLGSDASTEDSSIADTLVQEIIDRIKIAGKGAPGLDLILEKLRPSKKNYLKALKSSVERFISGSNSERTWQRINRKFDYLKGKVKFQNTVNVILDVSGSMFSEWPKVLSYVYQNDTVVNLAQVDTEVTKFNKNLSKRDFKKLSFKGGGGTELNIGVQKFIDEKLNALPLVILTDGYTSRIDNSQYKGKILVLTTETEISFTNPDKVKQIKIEI